MDKSEVLVLIADIIAEVAKKHHPRWSRPSWDHEAATEIWNRLEGIGIVSGLR